MSRSPRRVLAVSALFCAACLLPQEDNLLVDLPPPLNRPPRIVETGAIPASRVSTVDGGVGCPDLVFSAPVEDPDLTDVLFYDFYVDAVSGSAGVAQGSLPPSGTVERAQRATYTVSFSAPGAVQTPGTHLVELLAADGPLVNRIPVPRTVMLADGGTRVDPTFAVSYVWQVTVASGACP